MSKTFVRVLLAASIYAMGAMDARAQSSLTGAIAGLVRDTSGAVLPGVTVEVASPALIEKVRSAVTDGQGQYKIVDLRPGKYSVTFTLPGFNSVKQDGLDLNVGFTATVSAEMKVGSLEETITVSGSSPLVDTQNARQQQVVSRELLNTLPTGATGLVSIAAITPGMTGSVTVGGSAGTYQNASQYGTTFHGKGGAGSVFVTFDGQRLANMEANGGTGYVTNTVAVEQVVIETGGISAETPASSVVMNMIPKDGGNTFSTTFSGLFTNKNLQQSNLSDELRSRGLTTVPKIVHIYDASGALGGPIRRDRLWFFTFHRISRTENDLPRVFYNTTHGTPFYTPDLSRPGTAYDRFLSDGVRLTWQASTRSRVTVFADRQDECQCRRPAGSVAAEALNGWKFDPQGLYQASWRMPATNKLLFEAVAGMIVSHWPNVPQPEVRTTDISILELSTGIRYNSWFDPGFSNGYGGPKDSDRSNQRLAVSYVTGSHSFKSGLQVEEGNRVWSTQVMGDLGYQFLNGRPASIQQVATPFIEREKLLMVGAFAQDQWTIKRMTVNAGVRFDRVNGLVPEQHVAAGPWVPARDFAAVHNVPNWKDISPRLGVAYDLFGTGKTALKMQMGRYLGSTGTSAGLTSSANPMITSVNLVQRTWTDANSDYVPNCDLKSPSANGECGAISNQNFGKVLANATRLDPAAITGFSTRDYLWDFSVETQQELHAGVSVSGGYYRNWYGNFRVTDNILVTAADYNQFCLAAPSDARLPGGGGNQICGLADVTPAQFGRVQNLVAPAEGYGTQQQYSDFLNLSLNARIGSGFRLSGGVDAGRTVTDRCFVVDSPQEKRFCRIVLPFSKQTQLKLNGSYSLPWDFTVSGTLQDVPGPQILANYTASNAIISPSLGRNLAACGAATACTATVTIPLIEPGTMFEDRLVQVDLRVSKLFKVTSRARFQANVDIYNALNASTILTINNTFGPLWRQPASVLNGRMLQLGGQLTF